MAILKKKMAGKPAMMKKSPMRKAKNGDNVAKSDTTNRYNPKTEMHEMNKPLKEVKVKTKGNAFTTALKDTRNFLKTDFAGAKDSTRTKGDRTVRKIGNTIFKTAYAPLVTGVNLLGAAASPFFKASGAKITDKDKAEGRLYYSNRQERAAQKAASDSTNAANAAKTANAAKKKMGGKVKKYQAGGVVGKQPKAGMVDPKGAYTKVQKRTIAGKKTAGKKK